MAANKEADPESDRELVVTRTINGPRPLVFEAFTDPKHLGAWWGPNGFTTTTHRFDFRPGGVWDYTMHGPDGTGYPNYVEYQEIAPPDRIVSVHGASAGDPDAFMTTIVFVERGGATEITMRSLFKTTALRDLVVARFNAIEGGKQTLARLNAYVISIR
ncbi:MAG: SRPBCC family protein [bacterium]